MSSPNKSLLKMGKGKGKGKGKGNGKGSGKGNGKGGSSFGDRGKGGSSFGDRGKGGSSFGDRGKGGKGGKGDSGETAAVPSSQPKLNPFEERNNKKTKHEVLNRRIKGGTRNVAKARCIGVNIKIIGCLCLFVCLFVCLFLICFTTIFLFTGQMRTRGE
jgi:hypothetical protein